MLQRINCLQHGADLGLLLFVDHQRGSRGVLEDLADAVAGLGRALEVLVGVDSLRNAGALHKQAD